MGIRKINRSNGVIMYPGNTLKPLDGFSQNWVNLGYDTRCLLQSRDGFPPDESCFYAKAAAAAMSHIAPDARLVTVFYDDKNNIYSFNYCATNLIDEFGTAREKEGVESRVEDIMSAIVGNSVAVDIMLAEIPAWKRNSDHYNHMAAMAHAYFREHS